ncbi:UDP-glucose 4-epimerase GalE [Glaciihabitans arcticus]|uniref:UDP-glucose 4-epimerase n=1 Tax=Glaciihabitans arcticus TaxID=2668039 RepID=A0A4V2JEL6_9MICO|nr:UDP-glucose 4-epimerase GalE [Glaciihabitans arcticus]TBN56019.1 UDP-glucose 4-epimerase GalE [Glaciihabitans arcticus]
MKILLTGGAGYIGSTIANACVDQGIEPIILDDFSKGRRDWAGKHVFFEGDVADGDLIDSIFAAHPDISAVIHCAAKIVVPESVEQPVDYYANNVGKGISMLQHLRRNGCERVIFSSSASIYSVSADFTVDENSPINPTSPYANSKAIFESVLRDGAAAGEFRAIALRYFNPIGADPQLRTGLQDPLPSHVLGKLVTAARTGVPFTITGMDWPTRDGSGIRDFIHVWDLALAHVAALKRFDEVATPSAPYAVLNIGTGLGTTVKEFTDMFIEVSGSDLEVLVGPARPGDAAGAYTTSDRAPQALGWTPQLTIEDGIRDSLRWAEKFAG